MSNVLNSQDIKSILKRPNDLHERLMMQSCFRALERDKRCLRVVFTYPQPAPANLTRKQFKARGPFYQFVPVPEVAAILERIDRWLATAIKDKERWIEKTDNSGRITRLRNIKTLEDALALCEADEERARRSRLAQKDLEDGNDPRDVQIAQRFCDGTFAVKLKSPSALCWEARQMRHCLSNPTYAVRLVRGRVQYFSIRDALGRPHVTLEVAAGRIIECKGRANSDAFLSYGDKIEALADMMGWRSPDPDRGDEPELLHQFGLDRLVLERDVTLSEGMLPLARTLYVNGTLTAIDLDRLTTLPSVLHVGGDLIVRRCRNLRHMPKWLRVEGDTIIERCGTLRRLADHFSGGGSVALRDCPQLRLYPSRTIIGKALEVRRCPAAEASLGQGHISTRVKPIRQPHATV